MYDDLCDGKSVGETGTLYQLKQRFDRRNVKKDVKSAAHACRDFINFVTYGYTVIAAMKIKDMADKDAKPSDVQVDMTDTAKESYLDEIAAEIVRCFVLPEENEPEDQFTETMFDDPTSGRVNKGARVACGYPRCQKNFAYDGLTRQAHREKCQFKDAIEETDVIVTSLDFLANENEDDARKNKGAEDFKLNYSRKVLREGLLDLARKDASNEGDGERICILWKYDFMSFVASNHSNYAWLAFNFIAQVEFLLSPRKAKQLLHNRTINNYGGEGRNIPIDYAIELLNGTVKPDLKHKFGVLTEETIERTGKCLKETCQIEENIDTEIEKFTGIGRHQEKFYENEVQIMVEELIDEKLFDDIPNRHHKSFPKMKAKKHVNWRKLEKWLCKQIEEMAKRHDLKALSCNDKS